jgi:translation initiation factor IF-2
MNTIQITNDEGQVINYTETEIKTIIKNGVLVAEDTVRLSTDIRKIRNEVRDFFSEREWENRETTVNLDEVNELLNSIGSHSIQSTYSGSITISVNFSDLEADNEDDAISRIEDDITVELYNASVSIDSVSVEEIEAE